MSPARKPATNWRTHRYPLPHQSNPVRYLPCSQPVTTAPPPSRQSKEQESKRAREKHRSFERLLVLWLCSGSADSAHFVAPYHNHTTTSLFSPSSLLLTPPQLLPPSLHLALEVVLLCAKGRERGLRLIRFPSHSHILSFSFFAPSLSPFPPPRSPPSSPPVIPHPSRHPRLSSPSRRYILVVGFPGLRVLLCVYMPSTHHAKARQYASLAREDES